MYSLNFADGSSDKNNSSGKETYVLDCDDSDDSDNTFDLQRKPSAINIKDKPTPLTVNRNLICPFQNTYLTKHTKSASSQQCTYTSTETFTQTSKTIIELAQADGFTQKATDNQTLETQTSFISVIQNRTVEYTVETTESGPQSFTVNELNHPEVVHNKTQYNIFDNSLEDGSSKGYNMHETDNDKSDELSIDCTTKLTESNVNMGTSHEEQQFESASGFETYKLDSDIEEDLLLDNEYVKSKLDRAEISRELSEISKSVDNDVKDIYSKLSKSMSLTTQDASQKINLKHLTPVTEESVLQDSMYYNTPVKYPDSIDTSNEEVPEKPGLKLKLLMGNYECRNADCDVAHWSNKPNDLKLPPIQNPHSYPPSPNLNYLFTVTVANGQNCQAGPLTSVLEKNKDSLLDIWDMGAQDAGESIHVKARNDSARRSINQQFQLPPIPTEGTFRSLCRSESRSPKNLRENPYDSININDKIKELKLSNNLKPWALSQATMLPTVESRESSPVGIGSPKSRLNEASEKGCEALCVELLRGLRSSLWFEIVETLEEIPRLLAKFWGVITEHRIADLIRQVSAQVESPRTHVARCACNTIAAIVKNTNYTKKPDFYEAMTLLLVKTGSYSRPVRHAANVALDDIVCAVDVAHAVTALSVHGVGHRSALVRCAAARLLVICAALAGGGRELLKSRPTSAVNARRQVLRSLSNLLEDKNGDTRKYAERLYTMLRPLMNFEAFYLTDVDVEKASRQMKKYDQLLLPR